MRKTVVLLTLFFCFLTLLGVLAIAGHLGLSPREMHGENVVFDWRTNLVALSALTIPMIVVLFVHRAVLKSRLALGFKVFHDSAFVKWFAFGLALEGGSALLALALFPHAPVHATLPAEVKLCDWLPPFSWFFFMLCFNSVSEELVYRAFPLVHLERSLTSVLTLATIFSAMHFLTDDVSLAAFTYRLAFGALAGLVFLEGGSIWTPIALHTGANIAALTLSKAPWPSGGLVYLEFFNADATDITSTLTLGSAALYLVARRLRSARTALACPAR